jgi:hypothetical protein
LPQTCDGSDSSGAPWRVGVAGGGFRSELSFGAGRDVDIGEEAITATIGWHSSPRFGVEGGVGAILGGRLTLAGVDHDVAPGIAATVTASWLPIYEGEVTPFLLLAGTASVSTTTTDDGAARLTAVDLRATALVGKTFFDRLTPYVAVRVFGGPVFWSIGGDSVTGSDQHHYSIGGGATLRLPGNVDLFAEGMALGERSLNVGVGLSF